MSMRDKIILHKKCIIERVNYLPKNKAAIMYSRHRSIQNFIMNICTTFTANFFFENKLEPLPMQVENSNLLTFF